MIAQEEPGRATWTPKLVQLKNGDLLCVYYSQRWNPQLAEHIDRPGVDLPRGGWIEYVRSTDHSVTWGQPHLLADTPYDDRGPSVTQLQDGSLLAIWFVIWHWPAREYITPPGKTTHCAAFQAKSGDNGKTWSKPWRVKACDQFGMGSACFSPPRLLPNGAVIMPYYLYTIEAGRASFGATVISHDSGETWMHSATIGKDAGFNSSEPDIIVLKDGRLLCIIEGTSKPNHWFRAYSSYSNDYGRTWSGLQRLPFTVHAPFLLRAKSGVIVMTEHGPRIRLSSDEGRTWSEPFELNEGGGHSSVVELPDGTFLCAYNTNGPGARIIGNRFHLTNKGVEALPPPLGATISESRVTIFPLQRQSPEIAQEILTFHGFFDGWQPLPGPECDLIQQDGLCFDVGRDGLFGPRDKSFSLAKRGKVAGWQLPTMQNSFNMIEFEISMFNEALSFGEFTPRLALELHVEDQLVFTVPGFSAPHRMQEHVTYRVFLPNRSRGPVKFMMNNIKDGASENDAQIHRVILTTVEPQGTALRIESNVLR